MQRSKPWKRKQRRCKLSQRWSERFPQMEADYQARVSELDASARVLRRLLANGTT